MKKIIGSVMVAGLVASTAFGAMLNQGTRELGVFANIDRDSLDAKVSFGQFIMDGLIIGAGISGGWQDADSVDAATYGASAYAQYHFDIGSPLVPFVGAAAGVQYSKIDIDGLGSDSETGLMGEAQLGAKAFIANNIAITMYGFFDFSNEEIYSNKGELEKTDFGLRVGMNSYF
ncbi:MAG: outer membrane beta-barrel protein [Kiritimatiellia bacterium]|jgi:hypothetical protein